ncbi:MAG: hypothetical protein J6B75_09615 [Ruminococcus sp.]|nr:hypothetical protein [Ruminococcus sp.]
MSYFLGSEKSRFVNGEHQDSKTFDDCVENIISELNKYDNSVNSYDLKCEYIKNELGKLPRKPDGEIATIPQYIRLGIYYIAYTEYIKSLNNDDNTFRQDDLLKKLNLSKNMFQKWNLYPQKDAALYGKRIFNPSLVRKGAKRVKLCRLIRLLLTSQEAEYFADVFGGMGIVTSNVISYFKRPSFFNELDSVIFNMLHYIQVDKKALLKRCRGIFEDISKFKDEDNPMWYYGEERHDKNVFSFINEDFLPPLYGIYQGAYKNVIPDKYSESTQNTFYHWLERLENENISDEKKIEQELLIAAYTYFVFSFKINRGVSKADISGVNEFKFCLFLEKLKCDVSDWYSHQYIKRKFEDITISYDRKTSESEIYRWSDSLKDIEMTKKDYRDFYDYVSSKVDIEKIIWYFDPPYFLTAQYKNTFSDEQHVDLINILKEISAKGGQMGIFL